MVSAAIDTMLITGKAADFHPEDQADKAETELSEGDARTI